MNDSGQPDEGRDAEAPEGRYANYFEIGHNAVEFVLDFGQLYPGDERPHVHTRVVTSPAYAGALLETLGASLDRYEQTFGPIPRGPDPETMHAAP
jgi:hypothetical protein